MSVRRVVAAWLLAVLMIAPAKAAPPKLIVLIGGSAPHNPNVHDATLGIERLAAALSQSPDLRGKVTVRSFPLGWPADPAALARAATIVCYFDGLERHPLLDPARRDAMAKLMASGTGLVMFHQASTLPPADRSVPLADWLGGARYGMVDRTVERAGFTPLRHPIGNGVGRFDYRDEFYPSLTYRPGVVPILQAPLHLEAKPEAPPTLRTVAWAYTRSGGGRAFGFTGFHYLDTLDRPELRKLMLNGIVWSAGLKVPAHGIRSDSPWLAKGTAQ